MINKAVIPVAGLGTRYYPITKCIPKEMFPINNKPVIHYVMDEAIKAGIEDIAIVIRDEKTIIKEYIDMVGFGINITYVLQDEPLGLGDAIYRTKRFVGDEQFNVLLADDLVINENVTKKINSISFKDESIITVLEVDDVTRYGMVETNGTKITNMIEKPPMEYSKSNLGIVGRYLLHPDVMKYISTNSNKEIHLTDALCKMIGKYKMYTYKIIGNRYDIGIPNEYKRLMSDLL